MLQFDVHVDRFKPLPKMLQNYYKRARSLHSKRNKYKPQPCIFDVDQNEVNKSINKDCSQIGRSFWTATPRSRCRGKDDDHSYDHHSYSVPHDMLKTHIHNVNIYQDSTQKVRAVFRSNNEAYLTLSKTFTMHSIELQLWNIERTSTKVTTSRTICRWNHLAQVFSFAVINCPDLITDPNCLYNASSLMELLVVKIHKISAP